VARLVFRAAALRDLAGISDYIERESGSLATAEAFYGKKLLPIARNWRGCLPFLDGHGLSFTPSIAA